MVRPCFFQKLKTFSNFSFNLKWINKKCLVFGEVLFPSFVLIQMEQEKPIAEVEEPKEALFDFKIHRF